MLRQAQHRQAQGDITLVFRHNKQIAIKPCFVGSAFFSFLVHIVPCHVFPSEFLCSEIFSEEILQRFFI